MNATPKTLDPTATYVHLPDGGAALPVPVTETFWSELASGARDYPGRLMTAYDVAADMAHWEVHPDGDEVLVLLSGAVDLVFDGADAVALEAGSVCVVPAGMWHRFLVRQPGRMVAVTAGEGTRHRPL
ncbi:MAG: cupin domain-containing protein [Inquilinus sp.]|nr:cupin domain-containing protein [Inquilinus sp.]